jgi:D-specific alpha-keto acid dehydrogenase
MALGSGMPVRTTTRRLATGAGSVVGGPHPGGVGLTVYGCDPDEAALFEALGPACGVVPTTTPAPASEGEVVRVPANRCVSVGHRSAVTRPVLRALRDAGADLLCTRSIGLDHIDLAGAEDLGIAVANVRYPPDGVADHTLMLVLMALRGAKAATTSTGGHDHRVGVARSRDLRDLTVGVVGLGHIGSAVVQRLHGFGCRVLVCDAGRSRVADVHRVSLDVLLRSSDVVTLHLPLDATTHHLIGRAQIELMKDGAYLVNTARGALVDTRALVSALQRRKLGGVALDVVEGEERLRTVDHRAHEVDDELLRRLQAMPNAILTPHVAYFTERTLHDTVRQTIERCLAHTRSHIDG